MSEDVMPVIEHRRITGGGEQDVHTPWRKVLCYTQRAGATAKIKRMTRRRERREAREALRDAESPRDAAGIGGTVPGAAHHSSDPLSKD
jgi:hypothetical protein